jgi:hypothetical protein
MYTYKLNGVSVSPTGQWEIEYRKNEGQIFRRRYMTGKLTFTGDDYDYIMSLTECEYYDFVIYCGNIEFWAGVFYFPYSFHIDTDSCLLVGTPETKDEYTCIMREYEKSYTYSTMEGNIGAMGYMSNPVELRTCAGVLPPGVMAGGINLYQWRYWFYGLLGIHAMNCFVPDDIKSSFLWGDDFPNGDLYATDPGAGINYITLATNHLNKLYLVSNNAMRNAYGGTGCYGSSPLTISFKLFETWLRERFNAYWFIDENGQFRIEHVRFFLPGFAHSDYGSQVDLRTLLANCVDFENRKNKYVYQTDLIFDQEEWVWQHYRGDEGGFQHEANFVGEPIYYDADCVPEEPLAIKESTVEKLSTDCEWVIGLLNLVPANIDALSCDGYFLWDINTTPTPDRVACEVGLLNGVNVVNGHLSTANLMEHYFTWERIFLTGTMNGSDITPVTTFDSAIKKKLQDEIEFPWCCDEFDAMKQVTTELGDGTPYSVVQKYSTIKIQLLYD